MAAQDSKGALTGDERDDLEMIHGIGPKWADALYQIGICRFGHLAQYTPQDLARTLLAQAKTRVSPERIEANDWIGQARTLAREEDAVSALPARETEATQNPQQTPSKRTWEQHAAFSLFFDYELDKEGERIWQTRVYDNKSGVEEPLPGLEPVLWVGWILERAGLPAAVQLAPSEGEPAEPPAPVAAQEAPASIAAVDLSELWPLPDYPEKRLRAQVRLELSGPKAAEWAADRVLFRIEVYTLDLESGAPSLVSFASGRLEPERLAYTSQHEFPIPKLGRYQLCTLFLLLPPGEIMVSHRGPTFRVVA